MALMALLATAATDRPVLTVSDVIARHERLNGKIVRVRGWLMNECLGRSCGIWSSNTITDEVYGLYGDLISLGSSYSFDQSLAKANAVGKEIVVEGRVHRKCFEHPKGDPLYSDKYIIICADRVDQLADPKLIEVLDPRKK